MAGDARCGEPCALAAAFPVPGPRVRQAFHGLWVAETSPEKVRDAASLPRPWDPPTCRARGLRWELWLWLDGVVGWVNGEYVWDVGGGVLIPDCWPLHPHLVHEIAVLADQRRRAGMAYTSDALETWQRVGLPEFIIRMRDRLHDSCDHGHQSWPGRAAQARSNQAVVRSLMHAAFGNDLSKLRDHGDGAPPEDLYADVIAEILD